ncbi:MAG: aldehyde ferredoxin oxidoreductase [Syntrophomonadaceae bacterium]|nr:aldehyde ferredoxin oxidoreductase [Syntrophomonadaceae bacterium]
MSKILRVNMSSLTVAFEDIAEAYVGLGGRALTSKVVSSEVDPTCHPLGPTNKLVIAPGLLTGTSCPSSGRLSAGAKSPLTGTIKESNAGSMTSQKLASLGISAVVVEGQPAAGLFLLLITEEGAKLLPADEYALMGTYELNNKLREKYGTKIGVICIGPAGERKMPIAGISNNDMEGQPGRFCGRGGMGAVMGSKGLKAIVLQTAKLFESPVQNKEAFKEAAQKLTKVLRSHPVTGQTLSAYGTAVLVNVLNEAGGLPTRNFSEGRFEKAAEISGEAIAEMVQKRGGKGKMGHACHPGCVMRCSNIYPDENGEALCSPVEYETDWSLGANCGIGELDTIARLNRQCNDFGIDTIETGVALAVAMEAGVVPFGDGAGAIKLLEEIGQGTPMGRILGAGTETVGKVFGMTRVPVVKGQGIPAYDPRAVKGIGVTYATSTMGADHTAGYSVATNILKVGGYVDPLKPEGQADLSRNLQIATAAIDSAGLCVFTAFALLDIPEGMEAVIEMLNAKFGLSLTGADVTKLGQKVLADELDFNRRAGFTVAHDRLPEFFYKEVLPPHQLVFDVPDMELAAVIPDAVAPVRPA